MRGDVRYVDVVAALLPLEVRDRLIRTWCFQSASVEGLRLWVGGGVRTGRNEVLSLTSSEARRDNKEWDNEVQCQWNGAAVPPTYGVSRLQMM